MKKFVLFGDSLTQYSFDPENGWGAAIAHKYQRRVDVINRGLSGYNTRMALHELPKIVLPLIDKDTLVVTVWFGANDACLELPSTATRQGLPVAEYKANLTAIIQQLQGANRDMKILVMTPPPVYAPGRIAHLRDRDDIPPDQPDPTPDRTSENTFHYAVAALQVARAQGVASLDLFHQLQRVNPENWGEDFLGIDGLHFTARGQRAVGDIVLGALEGLLGLDAEDMPMPTPLWRDHALLGPPGE